MLRSLKITSLQAARRIGLFSAFAGSGWRRNRLLILCYHGLSLKDEHLWANLYLSPDFFRRRLAILARLRYRVLPLGQALSLLREGALPPRSVVITFDDGFYDFHRYGFPALSEFGFPATVYQTSYYCSHPYPIYNLVLNYLFWRGAGRRLTGDPYQVPGVFELQPSTNVPLVSAFCDAARRAGLSEERRNEIAAAIAAELGVDYGEIMGLRMFQLMNAGEVAEIARAGIDIQLHTHRHRTPRDRQLFVREIRDNRQWLSGVTGTEPTHFCYPSGVHHAEFLPWLHDENVVSATTCEHGIASRASDPLLLPRLLDSMHIPDVEFEGWLSGISALLPQRHS